MAYPVHNPQDPMQDASEDLSLAAGNAIGLGLWQVMDTGLIGGAISLGWGATKGIAKAGYGAGRLAVGAAGAVGRNSAIVGAAGKVAKGTIGAVVGGTAAVGASVIGGAASLGWGMAKATGGIAVDAGRAAMAVGRSRPLGAAVLGGAVVAGVAAAAWPSSYSMNRGPAERGAHVSDLMHDMNADGNIVLGMHQSR